MADTSDPPPKKRESARAREVEGVSEKKDDAAIFDTAAGEAASPLDHG